MRNASMICIKIASKTKDIVNFLEESLSRSYYVYLTEAGDLILAVVLDQRSQHILEEAGHHMDIYDPYYSPNKFLQDKKI
jgi:hypothetical protein